MSDKLNPWCHSPELVAKPDHEEVNTYEYQRWHCQKFADDDLEACIEAMVDELHARRVMNSTTNYSVDHNDFVCMIMQMSEDASEDELADAFNAMNGRDFAQWIEGDGRFMVNTFEHLRGSDGE